MLIPRRSLAALTVFAAASLALLSAHGQSGSSQGFVERDGAQLFYKSEGTGPAMVLIHGYPLGGELFKNNRFALAAAGYRVVTVDLRGFGRSSAPVSDAGSIPTYAQDVLAVMDKLEIKKAVIGGMSMGGMIAFELYRRVPERFARYMDLSALDSSVSRSRPCSGTRATPRLPSALSERPSTRNGPFRVA